MHTSNFLCYFLQSPNYHCYEDEQQESDGEDLTAVKFLKLLLPYYPPLRRLRRFGISRQVSDSEPLYCDPD
jgi:hypothetical protein